MKWFNKPINDEGNFQNNDENERSILRVEVTPSAHHAQILWILTNESIISSYILFETIEENKSFFQLKKSDTKDWNFTQPVTDMRFVNGTLYFSSSHNLGNIRPEVSQSGGESIKFWKGRKMIF